MPSQELPNCKVQGQWIRWMNYVHQGFSRASLLAMPAKLTSFCLASTYDTLPSPANFKRLRIPTEATCTVCSKDVCTTAHILEACKVLLLQGRYTFRHDTVLHQLIKALTVGGYSEKNWRLFHKSMKLGRVTI